MSSQAAAPRAPIVVGLLFAASLDAAFGSHTLAVPARFSAQSYRQQPGVFPVFDGWETTPDGGRVLYFGYMNRHPRAVTVPIGSENGFEPGPADRGQPAHFLPGRQKHVFTVRVPADFKDKLVWSLTSEAGVQRANGSLNQLYILEEIEEADPGANVAAPQVRMVDADLTVKASGTLQLKPQIQAPTTSPSSAATGSSAPEGELTVWWSKYRGPGAVTFGAAAGAAPAKAATEGREPGTVWVPCAMPPTAACGAATARFGEPGEYVLRVLARRRRVTRAPVAQFVEGSATVRVTVK
jgi:hypothetical protein